MTTITQVVASLPTAPTRDNPTNFSARGDALMTALPAMVTEFNAATGQLNTVAGEVNANAATATTNASTATTKAAEAAASAASAALVAGTFSTSTTSTALTASTTKTMTTQTGKIYPVGASVKVARTSDVSKFMVGSVVSYDSVTTGVIVLNVDVNSIQGSGTFTDWTLSISGAMGLSSKITNVATSSSLAAYSLTSTPTLYQGTNAGAGNAIVLPDATACAVGGLSYILDNRSSYQSAVYNFANTLLGFIPPMTASYASSYSAGTSAGNWTVDGLNKIGITARTFYNGTAGTHAKLQSLVLDADRTFYGMVISASGLYGKIYNKTTRVWGSLVTIRGGVTNIQFSLALAATDVILVVSCGVGYSAMSAVTLSCTGTSFAPNTPVPNTLAGNLGGLGEMLAVSTGWVVAYNRATTTSAMVGLTVSGTVPAFGSEVLMTTSAAASDIPRVYISGSIARTFTLTTTPEIIATPYTVSGSSLTPGTPATTTCNSPSNFWRSVVNGSGNVTCLYERASNYYVAIAKLTGTVEAFSVLVIGATGYSSGSANVNAYTDYLNCANYAAKMIFGWNDGTTAILQMITDTAGVPTIGTQLSLPKMNGTAPPILLGSDANYVYTFQSLANSYQTLRYTISGSSVSASNILRNEIPRGATPILINPPNYLGYRDLNLLSDNGTNAFILDTLGQNDIIIRATAMQMVPAVGTFGYGFRQDAAMSLETSSISDQATFTTIRAAA